MKINISGKNLGLEACKAQKRREDNLAVEVTDSNSKTPNVMTFSVTTEIDEEKTQTPLMLRSFW